ncbi:NUDIX hydrolase [Microlunatus flavus]|uniref:NUDIX domain-containing protein n=1 Tax=Microlunatus flavus TaxID=1036181 RepID=A0A1H8ZMY4_9ACTN|nr:CoA pyrophosphatase [Microlunatus flavus]SEP65780.1 NUDIX domain-containing protein [Microlunatus flavus]
MSAVRPAGASEPDWVGRLRTALHDDDRPWVDALRPARGARQSAVLALFGDPPGGRSGPEVLLVERAHTLRSHPGQIAFPGGGVDAGDVDLADTALREAYEECGVVRDGVEVLGCLPPAHVRVSGFDVTTVVGWWRDPHAVAPGDPGEVAAVLSVPVADLVDPANRATARHPLGYRGPAFTVADHLVWGLTAHLLDAVLDLAGWSRPWDAAREVGIPERYLRDRRASTRTRDDGGPDAH